MNTPKLIHARGSLLLKIINSAQSDSYDNRYLAFKVQTNRILFRSPEDGNAWSDLQGLMKRWYNKPEESKIIVEGQISLDALPASPFPAFYGLTLEYSPKEVVMGIEHQEVFGEGSNLSFSNLQLQFFDRPDQTNIALEGSVSMSYRGSEPLQLNAQITEEGMAFIAEGDSLSQFQVNHPFLASFATSKLEVKSDVQRWEDLETQFTFGESGGNLVYDYAGKGEELNLRVKNRNQIKWSEKGLQLLVQHDDYKKNPQITSERTSRRLIESIKNSGEMSVEIWMKSANLKQIGPAELVSLEKNERRRNFALGQGPEGKPNKNKAKLPNGSFLNARISASGTDRDGEPGIQSPLNSLVLDTTHVVFTRNTSGKTALYLNGTCCVEGKASGSLEDWEDDLNLIIGNDTRFSGPWEGELYHLSIYSKALSEKEVHAHFNPQLYVEGTAHLAKVPAPLTSPLDAKWHIQPDSSVLAVHGFGLHVANQLRFENVDMKLHIDGAGKMKPSGDIRTSLWGNEFLMAISKKGGQNSPWPNLKMHDPGITAYFDFGHFARVSMQSFSLLAGKSTSDPQNLTWHMEEVAGVFINDFPDVVDGISKIDLKLEGEGVEIDIVEHNHSFSFLQHLNMRFRNEELSAGSAEILMGPIHVEDRFSQWAVTPFKQYKIGFLVNQFGMEFPSEVNDDPQNDEKTTSQFFGVWNPNKEVRMYLGAAFMKRHGNRFGLLGGLDKSPEVRNFMHFKANGCFVFGDRTRTPVMLEGSSTLSFGDQQANPIHPFFTGDINYNEKQDRFLLEGMIDLFPDWSSISVRGPGTVQIQKRGSIFSMEESVEVELEDFKFLDPKLVLKNANLTLSGRWLGKEMIFSAERKEGNYLLSSEVSFEKVPFQLSIGPIYEPETGALLSEGFNLCQGEGCCEEMTIDMEVELTSSGFRSLVNASFDWTDEQGKNHQVEVPEFQLFWPPRSRNELLGMVLEEVSVNASEIFAPQLQHAKDYFVESISSVGFLTYRPENNVGADLSTQIATPFENQMSVRSDKGFFSIELVANNHVVNQLTVQDIKDKDIDEVKTDFSGFLKKIETEAGNSLKAGAINLIQSRIAERIIVPLTDSLFFHYGFEPTSNQVELKAGMRLRVEYQNFQFVPRSDSRAIQGFVGSGNAIYEINQVVQAGKPKISFDPFLSSIHTSVSQANGSSKAGGLLDLAAADPNSYYKLSFPSEYGDVSQAQDSDKMTVLKGANSWGDLFDGKTTNRNILGRAVIIPEIQIFVNEEVIYVPIGTTLRQILERSISLPSVGLIGHNPDPLHGAYAPRRLVHEGPANSPQYKLIQLGAYQSFGNQDVYDIPLVKGDRIYL